MEIFVAKAEVKSVNVFQTKQIYTELHDWLIENGYSPASDVQFPEKQIWESRQQSGIKEFWIWWRPFKVIEGNQLWRREINIDFHGVGIRPVEIMYNNKKIKADKGKFEVLLQGKLVIDRDNKWRNNWLMGPFFEIFWRRMFRKEIDQYRKEILGDLKTIQDMARRFYDIGAYSTDKISFMPTRGYQEREF